jgi:ATP-dependent DNA ligase
MSFETVYTTDKAGKTRSWDISVKDFGTYSIITTKYGLVGGIMTESNTRVDSGKNIGKKNATTHYTQALADAASAHTNKRKSVRKLPMLANVYNAYNKDNVAQAKYPCYVQAKLDGYRVLYDPNLDVFYSRSGKDYTCLIGTRIHERVKTSRVILDGEVYLHGAAFETYGILRKKKLSLADKQLLNSLEYHVYDVLVDGPFEKRLDVLNAFGDGGGVVKVVTQLVTSEKEMEALHKHHIESGFEGSMLRTPNGAYTYGFRSKDLLKYKNFDDAEFEIIGYSIERGQDGTGDTNGLVIWKCKISSGLEFDVVPKDTVAERKRLLQCADEFIGKRISIQFLGYTKNGIPRIPKTLRSTVNSIRDA